MTSKLGPYWSVMHRRPQDYAFFKQQQSTVFKIMDGGPPDYQWARDNLPDSLITARDWALSEQHADMLKDPIGTGIRHAREWNEHQKRLGFSKAKTLILGINEPHVWEPGVPEALRQYTIMLCGEATLLGLRVGAMQLSVGWPNNDGPDTPPNWSAWHGVDNAIRANNGALVVHEYWADNGPGENWGWWAGRVLKCPWQVPIVIGECGIDMYVKDGSVQHQSRGWRGRKSPEQYAAELADYTGRMSADSRFVGCTVFAADYANGEWASFDIEPAYQAILSTPVPEQPPIPSTPPGTVHLPSVGTGGQPTATVAHPDGVNVRSGPGVHYAKLGAEPYGTVMPIVGRNEDGSWWLVELPHIQGWVANAIVAASNTANVPVVDADETQELPPAPDQPQEPPSVPTGIIDPRVAQAILNIESGGRTHGESGKPLIRFEAHVFRDRAKDKARVDQHFRFDANKPWLLQEWRSHPDKPWVELHTGSQGDEYAALSLAQTIDRDAAYESISMGAGQLMGFHHARLGYPSAEAMFDAFQSAPVQTIGFLNFFLSDPGLVDAMRHKDWREIAKRYNGAGAVDTYAPLLQKAYEELA